MSGDFRLRYVDEDIQAVYRRAVERAATHRQSTFVEIGVMLGASARFLCNEIDRSGKHVHVALVDPWERTDSHADLVLDAGGDFFHAFATYAADVLDRPYVEVFRGKSLDNHIARQLDNLDFVFLDGDHSFDNVAREIAFYASRLRFGGVIAGHDYGRDFPDVVRAVRTFVPEAEIIGRCWWWERRD